MSLITELFGEDILSAPLYEVKEKIKDIPYDLKEKRSYLLKDYARIKDIKLTKKDFEDVNA